MMKLAVATLGILLIAVSIFLLFPPTQFSTLAIQGDSYYIGNAVTVIGIPQDFHNTSFTFLGVTVKNRIYNVSTVAYNQFLFDNQTIWMKGKIERRPSSIFLKDAYTSTGSIQLSPKNSTYAATLQNNTQVYVNTLCRAIIERINDNVTVKVIGVDADIRTSAPVTSQDYNALASWIITGEKISAEYLRFTISSLPENSTVYAFTRDRNYGVSYSEAKTSTGFKLLAKVNPNIIVATTTVAYTTTQYATASATATVTVTGTVTSTINPATANFNMIRTPLGILTLALGVIALIAGLIYYEPRKTNPLTR